MEILAIFKIMKIIIFSLIMKGDKCLQETSETYSGLTTSDLDTTWMLPDWSWEHFLSWPIHPRNSGKAKGTRKNITHEHNPGAEICLGTSSNFLRCQTGAPGHHRGAGATQMGHFDMILGVSGQVTVGAPEGP